MVREYYHTQQILEIFEFDEEFLDQLEDEDLIESITLPPSEERVFLPEQVERIRIISNLIRDLEVNLAGCGVILEMREQMIRMERDFDRILESLLDNMKKSY
jgi:DNA-binding transcriptional MerR regulator